LSTLTLHLTQFIEAGRSYTTTQLLLDAFQPRQLVVVGSLHHEVAGAAGVNQVTAAAWEQVHLARSAFDDTKGILAVQELTGWNDMGNGGNSGAAGVAGSGSAPSGAAGRVLAKSHYLAFGAAGALLQHVRLHLGLAVAPRALQVTYMCRWQSAPRHALRMLLQVAGHATQQCQHVALSSICCANNVLCCITTAVCTVQPLETC
jgi:hypothetical protein